eukprot:6474115-Amphidinium_carterae.1
MGRTANAGMSLMSTGCYVQAAPVRHRGVQDTGRQIHRSQRQRRGARAGAEVIEMWAEMHHILPSRSSRLVRQGELSVNLVRLVVPKLLQPRRASQRSAQRDITCGIICGICRTGYPSMIRVAVVQKKLR